MIELTCSETAEYLETATIESTTDHRFALVHAGRSASGVAFVLINDCHGRTYLTESL